EYCKKHQECSCHTRKEPINGMRLIDCEQMAIVEARASPWVALSYMWGETDTTPFPHLPDTITDAITVTKQLGYRYLRVDQYCIDQSNSAHRDSQLQKMDQIFMGAVLIIVAAA
ncbi:HET-domain-containing protein, partial [Setomelanomma holmii]